MDKPVKVKVIVTEFVETGAMHFKSVVQSLTGKNSVVFMLVSCETGRARAYTNMCGYTQMRNLVVQVSPNCETFNPVPIDVHSHK